MPSISQTNPFDERCKNDPQGVIKDLVKQTTKQAKDIHDLRAELDALKNPPKSKKKEEATCSTLPTT